jgi:hypothetical protein
MDPSSSDDECVAVQLDGSDKAPKAFKVILSFSVSIFALTCIPVRYLSAKGSR